MLLLPSTSEEARALGRRCRTEWAAVVEALVERWGKEWRPALVRRCEELGRSWEKEWLPVLQERGAELGRRWREEWSPAITHSIVDFASRAEDVCSMVRQVVDGGPPEGCFLSTGTPRSLTQAD